MKWRAASSILEGVGLVILALADWQVALGVFVFACGQNMRSKFT